MASIIEKIIELFKKQKNIDIYDENGFANIIDIVKKENIKIDTRAKIEKLDLIEFENLINLKEFRAKKREGQTGVSSYKLGSYWFDLPKGLAIFKDFGAGSNSDALRQTYMSNELMVAELAEQIGLPHAEYEPARIGNVVGLVSYDALRGAKISSVDIKNVFQVNQTAILNRQLRESLDIEQINESMFKMSILDILTLQADRNDGSFKYVIDEQTGKITMSALWDNERAFFENFTMRTGGEINFEDNLEEMQRIISNEEQRTSAADNNYCLIFNAYGLNERIKECIVFAKSNVKLIQILIDTINKIDIQSANEILKTKGITLNQGYLSNIGYIINQIKSKFIEEIEKQNVGELDKETGLLVAKPTVSRPELTRTEHIERVKKSLNLELEELESISYSEENVFEASQKYSIIVHTMTDLFKDYARVVISKQSMDFSRNIFSILNWKMDRCPDETGADGYLTPFEQSLINAKSVAVCVDLWAKKGLEREFVETLYLLLRRKAQKYKDVYGFKHEELDVFPNRLNEENVKNNPFLNRIIKEEEKQEMEIKIDELFKKFYQDLGQIADAENCVDNINTDNDEVTV